MLVIGLFLSLYWWWKMGRDEHFDEIALFDGYFLSLIVFFIAGRGAYVATHTETLGTLYRSLAILAYPGINGVVGIMAAILFMILFARSHNWDTWKVADSASVTLSIALVFTSLGGLLNGSNPGIPATWGLMYPGQDVARIPVDVWMIIWSLITFAVVSRVRKNFRFYSWYKGESSTAQEGLAALIFAGLSGVYYLVVGWINMSTWKAWVLPGEFVAGLILIMVSGFLIYKRVGRRDAGLWGKLMSVIRRS